MNAIRRIILTSAAALCLFVPLAATPAAQAGHGYGHVGNVQVRYYYLYYRAAPYYGWSYYGATANYSQAIAYAGWIRSQGYQVYLR